MSPWRERFSYRAPRPERTLLAMTMLRWPYCWMNVTVSAKLAPSFRLASLTSIGRLKPDLDAREREEEQADVGGGPAEHVGQDQHAVAAVDGGDGLGDLAADRFRRVVGFDGDAGEVRRLRKDAPGGSHHFAADVPM